MVRQLEDCRTELRDRSWAEAGIYEDNDISAFSGKERGDWLRLLADIKAGRVDAVVAYAADRLTRDIREAEDFIDLAVATGLKLTTVRDGDYNLQRATGKKRFREDAVKSRGESETMSERLVRQREDAAAQGKPHGMVAFGYRRVQDYDEQGRHLGSHDEIFEEQASVIREAARRLLAGESVRSIAKSLNDRGIPSPKGGSWSQVQLRQVMLRDRNAGLRRHRGQVIGKAAWEPIYPEGTHDRVKALLADPSRLRGRADKGRAPAHLLSGIARCGRCDGRMRLNPGGTHKGKTIAPRYHCADCFRVGRKQEVVDDVVVEAIVARLSRPDAVRALASGRPERAEKLSKLIAEAEARMDLAADGFADGTLTGEQLRRISERLRPQIEDWKVEMAACAPRAGLLDLIGLDAEAKWGAAPLELRRMAVGLLAEVVILPVGSGRGFNPANVAVIDEGRVLEVDGSIRLTWKS